MIRLRTKFAIVIAIILLISGAYWLIRREVTWPHLVESTAVGSLATTLLGGLCMQGAKAGRNGSIADDDIEEMRSGIEFAWILVIPSAPILLISLILLYRMHMTLEPVDGYAGACQGEGEVSNESLFTGRKPNAMKTSWLIPKAQSQKNAASVKP